MDMTLCTCENCGDIFERKVSEVRRCQRKKFSIACSRSCGTALRNRKHSKGDVKNFHGKTGRTTDKFSSFRYFLNKARNRPKLYGSTDLTLEYLQQVWELQNGRCPYSHHTMELPRSTADKGIKTTPYRASLDRIDSSQGYIQGNVEFVCYSANLAKNSFTRPQMIEFFKSSHV